MPAGRPTDYCQEIVERICDAITDGASLRTICKREDMPAISAVMRWINIHPDFEEQYERARTRRADVHAEEILEIADDSSADVIPRTRRDGAAEGVLDREHVERSKLRIDARFKLMAQMNPKKFGPKIDMKHSGALTLEGLVAASLAPPKSEEPA